MKKNKKGTSIIEAMVAMLIIVTGVVGMYSIYMSSFRLEATTSNKMKAISIAREGIEAMTNIRDTNWIKLGSDMENCWNTLNYQTNCINNPGTLTDIENNGHYKIYQNTDNKWMLSAQTPITSDYSNANYKTNFKVGLDSNGFYNQTGTLTDLTPLFTREIIVKYIDTNGDSADSNDKKMEVTSLVQWTDSSSSEVHKVELKSILSNWKE